MLNWIRKWIADWRTRHCRKANLLLHAVGIPATVAAVPAAILGRWVLAIGLFVGGYALQFLGHLIEGNRSGEEMLLRRLMGKK